MQNMSSFHGRHYHSIKKMFKNKSITCINFWPHLERLASHTTSKSVCYSAIQSTTLEMSILSSPVDWKSIKRTQNVWRTQNYKPTILDNDCSFVFANSTDALHQTLSVSNTHLKNFCANEQRYTSNLTNNNSNLSAHLSKRCFRRLLSLYRSRTCPIQ